MTGAADLRDRLKQFALRVIRMCEALPSNTTGHVIGRQALRSGTSVGANYREAQRARSRAEFISKVEICQQELDETAYWLELISEAGLMPSARLTEMLTEADELQGILTAVAHTSKANRAS